MRPSLLLLLLILTACARPTAPPTVTPLPTFTLAPTSPPTPTLEPSPTRPVPPVEPTLLPTPGEPVALTFNARDGALLAATYYPPIVRPAPAVLLLHQLGGSRADWDTFARKLQTQGYAALAIDLRGFGASAKPEDWAKAPDDVRSAWQVLLARPEVDQANNRTAIVGASIGANLALMVGGSEPRVAAVAALSPGLDYHGLNPSASMRDFGERPVYLVASKDDAYSYTSAQSLAQLSLAAQTLFFDAAGHGMAMFQAPTLESTLVDWLNKHVRDLVKG